MRFAFLRQAFGQGISRTVLRGRPHNAELTEIPRKGGLRDAMSACSEELLQLFLARDRSGLDELQNGVLALVLVRHSRPRNRRSDDSILGKYREGVLT